jgi:hypothetical protein
MTSILKQTPGAQSTFEKATFEKLSVENFIKEFQQQLQTLELSELELVDKKLKFLGLNFDPFNQETSPECEQIMDTLGLTVHLRNPYQATNILLQLLDMAEEELTKLKN